MNIDAWLRSGRHLPRFLRDFHDQKVVFKAIDEIARPQEMSSLTSVTWIQGHIYVIDVFLWWMARRGYTLQRSRSKQEFVSLEDTLREFNQRQIQALKAVLSAPSSVESADSKED